MQNTGFKESKDLSQRKDRAFLTGMSRVSRGRHGYTLNFWFEIYETFNEPSWSVFIEPEIKISLEME